MIKGSFKRPIPCRRAFMTTSILCIAVLAVPAAFAQQALPAPVETDSVEAADVPDAAPAQDAIIVTGSRLVRSDLSAPSPLTIVGVAALALSGNVTIENTLNEFPQLASGKPYSANNGGAQNGRA